MQKSNLSFYLLALVIILTACLETGFAQNIKISFKEVGTIGKEVGNPDEMISGLADIKVDINDNVYIADYQDCKVKKYSPTGKLLKVFGRGMGNGPGEFKMIRSLSVDKDENVYVTDMGRRIIAIFNKEGVFIKEVKCRMWPLYIITNTMKEVYFLGFWNDRTEKVIKKLDLTKEIPEQSAFEFCDRFKGSKDWEIANTGYTGSLFNDNEKNIYYAAHYPYYIRKFSPDGALTGEYKRDVYFYEPPVLKQRNPQYVESQSGSQRACLLGNKYILNMLFRRDDAGKKITYYLDVWDKESGQFLGMVPEKELGVNLSLKFYADSKGYFYNYAEEPYPHIKKYKVVITTN